VPVDVDGPPPHPESSTRAIPAEGSTTVVRGRTHVDHGRPGDAITVDDGARDHDGRDADGGHEERDATTDRFEAGPPRRRRRWLVAMLAVLGLLAASAAGGYLLWDRVLAPITPIPAVEGAAGEVATDRLEEAGFTVRVANERPHHLEVPTDHVLEQSLAGEARQGATVVLTLSAGPRQVEVPDVRGEPVEEATAAIADVGLTPVSTEEYDEEVAAGLVLSTDPGAGTVLDETGEVAIVVSRGPRPIEVADVRGRPLEEATAVLREAGLELEVVDRRFDEEVPAGVVLSQDPAPAEILHRGDTVSVAVSRGPEPVAVPNVRGKRSGEAIAELEALGFEVEVERRGGFGAFLNPDRVFDQDPAPDASRRRGDTVTVYAYED
jgi:eukaryotic-like serine/threonine-protein kinase